MNQSDSTIFTRSEGGVTPSDSTQQFTAGSQIHDFTLIKPLGQGGMGTVWEAHQESLERHVALKLILPEQVDAKTIQLFQREARAGGKLQHRNIVAVYGAGEANGTHFIAQELIADGHNLGNVIADANDGNRLPEGYYHDVASFTSDIARAMHVAHEMGIVHRDLKPRNILIDGEGNPKVTDFGLAHIVDEKSLTDGNSVLGTYFYMSPEQAMARGLGIDQRADIFSLGVVLYEMLTLRRPFLGDTPHQILEKVLQDDPIPPHRVLSRIPTDLSVICLKAMEKKRDLRYQTMGEMADDLDRVLRNEPILAQPASRTRRLQKWVLRHPTRSVALGLGIVTMITMSIMFLVTWRTLQQLEVKNQQLDTARNTAVTREQEAVTARRVAEVQSAEIQRLSDARRLRVLEERAASLWPARPERTQEMQDWLRDADRLVENLPLHKSSLQTLLGRARRVDEVDGVSHPVFPQEEDAWWFDTLQALVYNLEEFVNDDPHRGLRASVRDRLKTAQTIRQRTVVDMADDWEEAQLFISEDPRFEGLDLSPQVGLVPIGPDPETGLWEFWVAESGERPQRDPDTERILNTPETGMVLVLIPGGTFWMGSQSGRQNGPNFDPEASAEEFPHEITLDPFFLSKFEVTQNQWERLVGNNPSFNNSSKEPDGLSPLRPVDQVSYEDCVAALRRVGLTLPTEAQWEYSARAGTDTPYGTDHLGEAANLADQEYLRLTPDYIGACDWNDGHVASAPIGTFAANDFGLHDMLGNVWEWCLDWYAHYKRETAPGTGERFHTPTPQNSDRVLRGGGYASPASFARIANRGRFVPNSRDDDLGVRAARAIDAE